LEEQGKITKKLKPLNQQQVYFTSIAYDDKVYDEKSNIDVTSLRGKQKILVAGIAKPKPFFDYLKGPDDICLSYPDHHDFSEKEITELEVLSRDKIIITTEKDYVRLSGQLPQGRLFYLPIRTSFIANADNFDKSILDYVYVSQNV
jgi:tetraacyldisaccharide 4'-kinase